MSSLRLSGLVPELHRQLGQAGRQVREFLPPLLGVGAVFTGDGNGSFSPFDKPLGVIEMALLHVHFSKITELLRQT